jgi:isoleucyl-tRNA synthetase
MNTNYKQTLNLPQTNFSMQARLRELEPKILDLWSRIDIYKLARKNLKGRPKYILHDGPPYANGSIHLGHALNKILKDFVVKYKMMQGFDIPFIPGWDCHGLPVEHQLLKELGISKHEVNRVEFRKMARAFALKFVGIQKREFQRLGLIADWQRPYLTLDFAYEAEIVRVFAKLLKDKYVYRGLKPIQWCMTCETALAEAEVEYTDHRSPSIYVKFELLNAEELMQTLLAQDSYQLRIPVSLLIWTTTPWTLVSNVAIASHPQFEYSFLEVIRQDQRKEILIVAEKLVDSAMQQIQITDYKRIGQVNGRRLEGLKARHPFFERNARLVLADYVSDQEGTGLVHTAPGHGQEDYLTGLRYKLPVIMPVDEQGRFDKTAGEFQGHSVFQANELIIEKMRKNETLLFSSDTLHSYPHCWRCKQPLITRSTKQWFINVDHCNLRKKALAQIRRVKWIPQAGQARINNMVQMRPDWCLSRQRFWGVPIPVVYCKNCRRELLRDDYIERFAQVVSQVGSDAWFTEPTDKLLGKRIRCPQCKAMEFIKENDIIDVWFESGISHQAVLSRNNQLGFPASLYLEGSDQHRGWFQTALLTSVPLTGRAPYQQVLTHGFVVDGEGRKMSKSRGNVISPQQVIERYGAEILRLWVASCDYSDDVRISAQILSVIVDGYRKIRNTLRFLLGNLDDFLPEKKLKHNQLEELDRWALSRLADLQRTVTQDYEGFQYYKVFRRLYNFCVREMSSFYLDVLKDRLYTFGRNSRPRRSAQTALYEILISLTKIIAPIFSFTAEEVWGHLNKIKTGQKPDSVFLHRWPRIEGKWINHKLDQKVDKLIKVRNEVLKAIELEREKGLIGSSLESRVRLYPGHNKDYRFLNKNIDLLVSIFIVSDVSVERPAAARGKASLSAVKIEKIDFSKCARCWNYRSSVGRDSQHPKLCNRCLEVLKKERQK